MSRRNRLLSVEIPPKIICSLTQRAVGKMGVPCCRLRLRVTKELSDDMQRLPGADEMTREGMPEVMHPHCRPMTN